MPSTPLTERLRDAVVSSLNFGAFYFGLFVIGPLYGIFWCLTKITGWALFHAVALVLWIAFLRRVKVLSLFVSDKESA